MRCAILSVVVIVLSSPVGYLPILLYLQTPSRAPGNAKPSLLSDSTLHSECLLPTLPTCTSRHQVQIPIFYLSPYSSFLSSPHTTITHLPNSYPFLTPRIKHKTTNEAHPTLPRCHYCTQDVRASKPKDEVFRLHTTLHTEVCLTLPHLAVVGRTSQNKKCTWWAD